MYGTFIEVDNVHVMDFRRSVLKEKKVLVSWLGFYFKIINKLDKTEVN